nr:zeta toxin family protein [Zavarzinella formosa]
MPPEEPLVVILGGINGAGKTTASEMLLGNKRSMPFVNTDAIARGLNAFAPERSAIQAGQIMLARLNDLADKKASFAFESTLSGRTYISFLRRLQTEGYRVELCYFWLPSPEMSIERVRLRVKSGGHHIPAETIRRRHPKTMSNFWDDYRGLADHWMMFGNAGRWPELTAFGSRQEKPTVIQPADFQLFQELIAYDSKPDN